MKIILENIGVFKYAEFTLADLSIICGKNNTGKSTAVYALYGFLDYFRKDFSIEVPLKDIQKLLDSGSLKINLDTSLSVLSEYVEKACEEYVRHLPKVLAAQEDYFSSSSFRVRLEETDIVTKEEYNQSYRTDSDNLLEIVKTKNNKELEVSWLRDSLDKEFRPSLKSGIQRILGVAIKDILFGEIFPESFIVSAERTGALTFNKELSIQRRSQFQEIANSRSFHNEEIDDKIFRTSYALPVQRDMAFIRNLRSVSIHLSVLSKTYPAIMDKIKTIVGGEYIVTSLGLRFIPADRKSVQLTIDECGSAVRSLMGIYFYLKCIAGPGQLLIIEEPEMSLHPQCQRKLARLISLLVNYGIRVLVTTHSDYILKELNTLIMLKARLGKEHIATIMSKYGYEEDELLDIEKLKVFVSSMSSMKLENKLRRTKIQTLTEANVEPIYGVLTDNFDEVIDEMNQIQEDIVFGAK